MNTLEARQLEADTLEAAADICSRSIASNQSPQGRTVERALEILFRSGAEDRRRTGVVLQLERRGGWSR